jgi:hypothetical protein
MKTIWRKDSMFYRSGLLGVMLVMTVFSTAQAQSASWSCSANSSAGEAAWSNAALGPVQRTADGFVIRRTTTRYPGTDAMVGRIGRNGNVTITGGGSYPSVGRSWSYRGFRGKYVPGGTTTVVGQMVNNNRSSRTCTINLNL